MSQISIIELSLVKSEKRFDAEFYKQEYLESESKITSQKFLPLVKLTEKIDVGFVGPMVHAYTENGILLLQTRNINEFFINLDSTISITEEFHKILKKSKVEYGDILIARSGSFGNASIYLEKEICNSSDIIIVRANEKINPFYLVAYLNSIFGRHQLYKFASGGLQGHVNLTILENLKVPILSESFQKKIECLILESKAKINDSVDKYKQAEKTLLNELNLNDYKPEHKLSYDTKLREILNSKRIDADYYQPKYKEIEQKIKNYRLSSKPLSEVIKIKNKNFFPVDDKEYKYIELSNISSNGNITSCTIDLGKNLPSRARRKVSKGDVIISTIEGALESCAVITDEYDGVLCSTGFFVINSKIINSETLLVLAKSIIMQNLLRRGCKGTILTAISKDELDKIEIPLIKESIQKDISQKIIESYKQRKESKELLEKAKKIVEDEIEKEAKK